MTFGLTRQVVAAVKNDPKVRKFAEAGLRLNWSGRRDSNPRQPAWKAGTLPLSYSRIMLTNCRPYLVGVRGFEPPTSASQTLRAKPTALHPGVEILAQLFGRLYFSLQFRPIQLYPLLYLFDGLCGEMLEAALQL